MAQQTTVRFIDDLDGSDAAGTFDFETGIKLVAKRGSTSVIQQEASDGVTYLVSDDTPYGLRITSAAFHGYKRDRWFFDRADFREGADEGDCLAARSN